GRPPWRAGPPVRGLPPRGRVARARLGGDGARGTRREHAEARALRLGHRSALRALDPEQPRAVRLVVHGDAPAGEPEAVDLLGDLAHRELGAFRDGEAAARAHLEVGARAAPGPDRVVGAKALADGERESAAA